MRGGNRKSTGQESKGKGQGNKGELKGDMKGTEMKTRGVQGERKGNKGQGNQSARREMSGNDWQQKNGTYMENEADMPRK